MKFCIFIAAVSINEVLSQIFMINFTAICGYSEGTSSEKHVLVRFCLTNSVNVQNSVWSEKPHFEMEHQLSLCGKFPRNFYVKLRKEEGQK